MMKHHLEKGAFAWDSIVIDAKPSKVSRYGIAMYRSWVRLGISLALFVCMLITNASADNSAIKSNHNATIQNRIAGMATELLSKSLQCPVPPIVVDWEGDGAYSVRDLITKAYAGDDKTLAIMGTNERNYYSREVNRTGTMRRNFEYRVDFADLASAKLGNDQIRIDPDESKNLINSSVVVSCAANKPCIQHNLVAPDCSPHALLSGECVGRSAISHHDMLSEMTIDLCDSETAENVKMAIEKLMAFNNAQAAPLPAKQGPALRTKPDMPAFRVLRTASGGILNMRDGPGSRHRLIVAVPAGADDLIVGSCRRADTAHEKPWCQTSWHGHAGWISACCIVDDKTGLAPHVAH